MLFLVDPETGGLKASLQDPEKVGVNRRKERNDQGGREEVSTYEFSYFLGWAGSRWLSSLLQTKATKNNFTRHSLDRFALIGKSVYGRVACIYVRMYKRI